MPRQDRGVVVDSAKLQWSVDTLSRGLGDLDPEALWALAGLAGSAWRRGVPQRDRQALEQLNGAIPGLEPAVAARMVGRMFRHLAAIPLEVLAAAQHRPHHVGDVVEFGPAARVRAVHAERLANVLARGRGALILTAHLGNFELALHSECARGFPLHVVTKRFKPRALDSAWRRLRRASHVGIIEDRDSLKSISRALDRGHAVVMALDQHAVTGHACRTTFFGKPAWTHRGLAFISARRRVPVVPTFITRDRPGHHTLRYLPPIDFGPRPGESFRAAIPRHTQHFTSIIEDAVRSTPEQWTWLHRRWKT